MDWNLILQYVAVAVFVGVAVAWVLLRLFRKKDHGVDCNTGCSGCALSKNCTSPQKTKSHKASSQKAKSQKT